MFLLISSQIEVTSCNAKVKSLQITENRRQGVKNFCTFGCHPFVKKSLFHFMYRYRQIILFVLFIEITRQCYKWNIVDLCQIWCQSV